MSAKRQRPGSSRLRSIDDLPEVATRDEVAQVLRLQPSTVSDLARRGEIGSLRMGRAVRFDREDVRAYRDRSRIIK